MNNKIEQVVIYFIYFAVVCFGLSILIFLGGEIIGKVKLYDFAKDHGSLIAGILAILAVAVTITYQNINTTKQIQAQNRLSENNRLMDKQEEVIELLAASFNTLSKTINAYGKKIKPVGFSEKDLWSDYVMKISMVYTLVKKYNLPGKNDAYELMSLASLASFLADRIYYVDSLGLAGSKSTKDFMKDLLAACHNTRDQHQVSSRFDGLIQYIVNIAWLNPRKGNDLILLTGLLEKMIHQSLLLNDFLKNKMMDH